MTTTLDTIIDAVESELNTLILSGGINAKKVWFTDIDDLTIEYPAVLFMLQNAERNDMQVIQTSSRISWDLNYDVFCLYSGLEGKQKFTHARRFVDSVYNLLQTQHAPGQRLNGECFDIECGSIEYGVVALDQPKQTTVTGGVIKLVIQAIELF